MKKTAKPFRALSASWGVASLFMLAYWTQHIISCHPACQNHWIAVALYVFILFVAWHGVRGSRRAFFILIVPAVIALLWCVTEIVVCVMVDELAFRFLYQPITGAALGMATPITAFVVKRRERTEPSSRHVPK
jgi:hypothetical protein